MDWWAGSTFKARGSCSRRLAILTTLLQRKSTLQEPELSLGGGLSVELVSGARAGGIESWSCEDTVCFLAVAQSGVLQRLMLSHGTKAQTGRAPSSLNRGFERDMQQTNAEVG